MDTTIAAHAIHRTMEDMREMMDIDESIHLPVIVGLMKAYEDGGRAGAAEVAAALVAQGVQFTWEADEVRTFDDLLQEIVESVRGDES